VDAVHDVFELFGNPPSIEQASPHLPLLFRPFGCSRLNALQFAVKYEIYIACNVTRGVHNVSGDPGLELGRYRGWKSAHRRSEHRRGLLHIIDDVSYTLLVFERCLQHMNKWMLDERSQAYLEDVDSLGHGGNGSLWAP
jgi:hypothetical protein